MHHHRTNDKMNDIISLDEILTHIFNLIGITDNNTNLLQLQTVSKQWRSVIFSLEWLKVSTTLFTGQYTFDVSRFNRLKQLKIVDSYDTIYLETYDDYELFFERFEDFADQIGHRIEVLELNAFSSSVIESFKNLTSITIGYSLVEFLPTSSLARLTKLKHVKLMPRSSHSNDIKIKLLDHVDLVELDWSNIHHNPIMDRTGRTIVYVNGICIVEGNMINGKFEGVV